MNIFDLEVYEKKKCVPSARHKKNGSKSKKCKLSTDGMTQRQLQKRNGAIMTYKLNRPMEWAEFKGMPVDVQERYLNGLVDKFEINAAQAGKMFGVTGQSVMNLIAKHNHNVTLNKKPMAPEQKAAFAMFMKGEMPAVIVQDKPVEPTPESVVELKTTIPVTCAEPTEVVTEIMREEGIVKTKMIEAERQKSTKEKDFKMSFFSLVFDGAYSKEEFMRAMAVMIPDGVDVSIKVKCEFNK